MKRKLILDVLKLGILKIYNSIEYEKDSYPLNR